MRETIEVNYELTLYNKRDGELQYEFSIEYNKEAYNRDIEEMDMDAVNTKFKELVEDYGRDTILVSFSIERLEGDYIETA